MQIVSAMREGEGPSTFALAGAIFEGACLLIGQEKKS